jgi:hypothetical protein
MTQKKSAQTVTFTAIGVAFALVISALTYFAESYPANFVLLGSGVVLLFVALILAQLRLWREGQAEGAAAAAATRLAPIDVRPAPPELKHGRFRGIWENLEETRRLMESKEENARQQERVQEKKRLGLPEEETILFMEGRSWLALWPVALLSLVCIAASSAVVSETGVVSFVWLVLGLGGFLFIATVKGRTTYYLTNFRILVRRKPMFKRAPRWSAMLYPEVKRYSCSQVLGGSKLTLVAKQGALIIKGLARPHHQAITKILLEKLPATAEGH